ncbi:urease accessory protein UreE [Pseudodesulfovibrio sp.]|uniref:urease accessory protein UreE n=1 Tax=unclassified Pseudodesulfovibrio TaxID=2661612 RepID=UPI003B00E3B3
MLRFERVVSPADRMADVRTDDGLTLPYVLRERSRQRVMLDSGLEAGLFLPRGTVLADGDVIVSDDGTAVLVRAQEEPLSECRIADPLALAKACFYLGNRHVQLEIAEGRIRYIYDPVVDDMLRGMGHEVHSLMAPFHPETGAYHMPIIEVNQNGLLAGNRQ